MGVIDRKQSRLDDLLRLRRAEEALPHNEDLVTVRRNLEKELGPGVTRAMAARILGVTQPALDRWIASGDIPSLVSPTGRREVPLSALLDIAAAVERRKEAGQKQPLAAVLHERRRDANKMDREEILPSRYRRTRDSHGHRRAELRSLALHRALARRLDERTVDEARHRVNEWRRTGRIDPEYADEWERILSWPIPRIAKFVTTDSQRARDLRQNSPFAGVLTAPERSHILESVG
jgi:hypothetical protein